MMGALNILSHLVFISPLWHRCRYHFYFQKSCWGSQRVVSSPWLTTGMWQNLTSGMYCCKSHLSTKHLTFFFHQHHLTLVSFSLCMLLPDLFSSNSSNFFFFFFSICFSLCLEFLILLQAANIKLSSQMQVPSNKSLGFIIQFVTLTN